MGEPGSQHAEYEKATWTVLKELTEKYPEAGIHFQGNIIHAHFPKDDLAIDPKLTNQWMADSISYKREGANLEEPWYKNIVPSVCIIQWKAHSPKKGPYN